MVRIHKPRKNSVVRRTENRGSWVATLHIIPPPDFNNRIASNNNRTVRQHIVLSKNPAPSQHPNRTRLTHRIYQYPFQNLVITVATMLGTVSKKASLLIRLSGGSGGRPCGPPGSTLSIPAKEGCGEEIPASYRLAFYLPTGCRITLNKTPYKTAATTIPFTGPIPIPAFPVT